MRKAAVRVSMTASIRALAASLLMAAFATPAIASDDLLQRASQINPHLNSYEASIRVDVSMKTFPFLSPTLGGTYYHKEPNMDRIVFSSGLPAIAQQFSNVYPRVESPSHWADVYTINKVGDNGSQTTYQLIPRNSARVQRVDARLDDRTATVTYMRWNYVDGSYAEVSQSYAQVHGNYLVSRQTGHVDFPAYKADLTSSYSGYRLNVPLSDSFFRG